MLRRNVSPSLQENPVRQTRAARAPRRWLAAAAAILAAGGAGDDGSAASAGASLLDAVAPAASGADVKVWAGGSSGTWSNEANWDSTPYAGTDASGDLYVLWAPATANNQAYTITLSGVIHLVGDRKLEGVELNNWANGTTTTIPPAGLYIANPDDAADGLWNLNDNYAHTNDGTARWFLTGGVIDTGTKQPLEKLAILVDEGSYTWPNANLTILSTLTGGGNIRLRHHGNDAYGINFACDASQFTGTIYGPTGGRYFGGSGAVSFGQALWWHANGTSMPFSGLTTDTVLGLTFRSPVSIDAGTHSVALTSDGYTGGAAETNNWVTNVTLTLTSGTFFIRGSALGTGAALANGSTVIQLFNDPERPDTPITGNLNLAGSSAGGGGVTVKVGTRNFSWIRGTAADYGLDPDTTDPLSISPKSFTYSDTYSDPSELDTVVFAGAFTGGAALNKTGAGSLILAGSSVLLTTNVLEGTLAFAQSGTFPATATVNVSANAVVAFGGANTLFYQGALGGTGDVYLTALAAGSDTAPAGKFSFLTAASPFAGNILVEAGREFTFDETAEEAAARAGAGTTPLAGSLANPAATVAFDPAGAAELVFSAPVDRVFANRFTGPVTLRLTAADTRTTFSGALASTVGLTVETGTATVSGTIEGTTTVNGGAVLETAGGTFGDLYLGDGSTLRPILDGATAGGSTVTGQLHLGSGLTLDVSHTYNRLLANANSDVRILALDATTGALSDPNNYSSPTNLALANAIIGAPVGSTAQFVVTVSGASDPLPGLSIRIQADELTWTNTTTDSRWEVAGSQNFDDAGGNSSAFVNGSLAIFPVLASSQSIVISGEVKPLAATFYTDSGHNYTLSANTTGNPAGPNAIAGGAVVTKKGTGWVEGRVNNTHTGGTIIAEGEFREEWYFVQNPAWTSGSSVSIGTYYNYTVFGTGPITLGIGDTTSLTAPPAIVFAGVNYDNPNGGLQSSPQQRPKVPHILYNDIVVDAPLAFIGKNGVIGNSSDWGHYASNSGGQWEARLYGNVSGNGLLVLGWGGGTWTKGITLYGSENSFSGVVLLPNSATATATIGGTSDVDWSNASFVFDIAGGTTAANQIAATGTTKIKGIELWNGLRLSGTLDTSRITSYASPTTANDLANSFVSGGKITSSTGTLVIDTVGTGEGSRLVPGGVDVYGASWNPITATDEILFISSPILDTTSVPLTLVKEGPGMLVLNLPANAGGPSGDVIVKDGIFHIRCTGSTGGNFYELNYTNTHGFFKNVRSVQVESGAVMTIGSQGAPRADVTITAPVTVTGGELYGLGWVPIANLTLEAGTALTGGGINADWHALNIVTSLTVKSWDNPATGAHETTSYLLSGNPSYAPPAGGSTPAAWATAWYGQVGLGSLTGTAATSVTIDVQGDAVLDTSNVILNHQQSETRGFGLVTLNKVGTGTIIVGTWNFGGTTNIAEGTVAFTDQSTALNPRSTYDTAVQIGDAGTLLFDRTVDFATAEKIGGTGTLAKAGSATVSITAGLNLFTGDIRVEEGVLEITEKSPFTISSLQIAAGAQLKLRNSYGQSLTLAGDGVSVIGGENDATPAVLAVTVDVPTATPPQFIVTDGHTLKIGHNASPAVREHAIVSNITFNNATLELQFGEDYNGVVDTDYLEVTGSFTATGTNYIKLVGGDVTTLGGGNFTLIKAIVPTGNLLESFELDLSETQNANRANITLSTGTGTSIVVSIETVSQVLYWAPGNATGANKWGESAGSGPVWIDDNGSYTIYTHDADASTAVIEKSAVIFDDVHINSDANHVVLVAENVEPFSVLVNNTKTYTFQLTGGHITGDHTSLTKQGAGTLVITRSESSAGLNDFRGTVLVQGGAIKLLGDTNAGKAQLIGAAGQASLIGAGASDTSITLNGGGLILAPAAEYYAQAQTDRAFAIGAAGAFLEATTAIAANPLLPGSRFLFKGGANASSATQVTAASKTVTLLGGGARALTLRGNAGTGVLTADGDVLGANDDTAGAGVTAGGVLAIKLADRAGDNASTLAALSLVKEGTGLWHIAGGNTYTGGTTLVGGALAVSEAGALGTGAITFAGGVLLAAAPLHVHPTTNAITAYAQLAAAPATFTLANPLRYDAEEAEIRVAAFTDPATGEVTAGKLTLTGSASGAGTLVKRGGGVLRLEGASNATGGARVAEGALVAANTFATGGSSNGGSVEVAAGARFLLDAAEVTVGGLTGDGLVASVRDNNTYEPDGTTFDAVGDSPATLVIAPRAGGDYEFLGTLADGPDGPLNITKRGDGVQTLALAAGAAANTQTGALIVSEGILRVPDPAALGTPRSATVESVAGVAGTFDIAGGNYGDDAATTARAVLQITNATTGARAYALTGVEKFPTAFAIAGEGATDTATGLRLGAVLDSVGGGTLPDLTFSANASIATAGATQLSRVTQAAGTGDTATLTLASAPEGTFDPDVTGGPVFTVRGGTVTAPAVAAVADDPDTLDVDETLSAVPEFSETIGTKVAARIVVGDGVTLRLDISERLKDVLGTGTSFEEAQLGAHLTLADGATLNLNGNLVVQTFNILAGGGTITGYGTAIVKGNAGAPETVDGTSTRTLLDALITGSASITVPNGVLEVTNQFNTTTGVFRAENGATLVATKPVRGDGVAGNDVFGNARIALADGTLRLDTPAGDVTRLGAAHSLFLQGSGATIEANGGAAVLTGGVSFGSAVGSTGNDYSLTLGGNGTGATTATGLVENTLAVALTDPEWRLAAKTALVKLGAGTWVLDYGPTGSASNPLGRNKYTGGTTISAGVLKLGADNALPVVLDTPDYINESGDIVAGTIVTGTSVILGGNSVTGRLDLNGHNQTVADLSLGSGGAGSAVINTAGGALPTLTWVVAEGGTYYKTASGLSPEAPVNESTAREELTGTLNRVTIGETGKAAFNFEKAGEGVLVLYATATDNGGGGVRYDGAVNITGSVLVSGGILRVAHNMARPRYAADIAVGNGAQLDITPAGYAWTFGTAGGMQTLSAGSAYRAFTAPDISAASAILADRVVIGENGQPEKLANGEDKTRAVTFDEAVAGMRDALVDSLRTADLRGDFVFNGGTLTVGDKSDIADTFYLRARGAVTEPDTGEALTDAQIAEKRAALGVPTDGTTGLRTVASVVIETTTAGDGTAGGEVEPLFSAGEGVASRYAVRDIITYTWTTTDATTHEVETHTARVVKQESIITENLGTVRVSGDSEFVFALNRYENADPAAPSAGNASSVLDVGRLVIDGTAKLTLRPELVANAIQPGSAGAPVEYALIHYAEGDYKLDSIILPENLSLGLDYDYAITETYAGTVTLDEGAASQRDLKLDGWVNLQITSDALTGTRVWAGGGLGTSQSVWSVETTDANFLDPSHNFTSYPAFGTALFDDTAAGSDVTVAPAGVDIGAVTFDNSALDYSVSGGAITGKGYIIKRGTGRLTLYGANDFSGSKERFGLAVGVELDAGTLAVGDDRALGADAVILAGGILARATKTTLAETRTISNTLIVFDGAHVEIDSGDGAGEFVLAGEIISNAGGGATLVKTGSAALRLKDNGTGTRFAGYHGAFEVASGKLLVDTTPENISVAAVSDLSGTAFNLTSANASLVQTGISGESTVKIGNLAGVAGSTLTSDIYGRKTFEIGSLGIAGEITEFAGNIVAGSGVTLSLTKVGAGTLALTGDASGLNGVVRVSEGELILGGGANSVPTPPQARIIVEAGAEFVVEINGTTGGSTFAAVIDGQPGIPATYDQYGNIATTAVPASVFEKRGTGALNISASNDSLRGVVRVSEGVLALDGAGTLGTAAVENNARVELNRADSFTFGNDFTGTGELVKTGAGTATWLGDNTASGKTTVSEGTLRLGDGAFVPDGTGHVQEHKPAVEVARGAALELAPASGGNVKVGSVVGEGALVKTGAGTAQLTGLLSVHGSANGAADVSIREGVLSVGDGDGRYTRAALDVASAITIEGGATLATSRTGAITFSRAITVPANSAATLDARGDANGNGEIILASSANNFEGTLRINRGAVVQIGSATSAAGGRLNDGSRPVTVVLDPDATLRFTRVASGRTGNNITLVSANPAQGGGVVEYDGGGTLEFDSIVESGGDDVFNGTLLASKGTLSIRADLLPPKSLSETVRDATLDARGEGVLRVWSNDASVALNTNFGTGDGTVELAPASTAGATAVTYTVPEGVTFGGTLAIASNASLRLDGTFDDGASPAVSVKTLRVNAGGSLYGTGTLRGDLQVRLGGTVEPRTDANSYTGAGAQAAALGAAAAPGTLRVEGNFLGEGALRIALAETADGYAFSALRYTGNAVLGNAATLEVRIPGSLYEKLAQRGEIAFLVDEDPVGGTGAANLYGNYSTGNISLTLLDDAGNAYSTQTGKLMTYNKGDGALTLRFAIGHDDLFGALDRKLFGGFLNYIDGIATGGGSSSFSDTAYGDAALALISALDGVADRANAFANASPATLGVLTAMPVGIAHDATNTLRAHLESLRFGRKIHGKEDNVQGYILGTGIIEKNGAASGSNDRPFDYSAYGAVAGLDANFGPDVVFGFNVGYSHGRADAGYGSRGQRAQLDSARITFYGSYMFDDIFFAEASVFGAYNGYELKHRNTAVGGGFHDGDSHGPDGYDFGGSLFGGFALSFNNRVHLTPYAGLEYVSAHIEKFSSPLYAATGVGAGGETVVIGWDYDSITQDSLRGRVGFGLNWRVPTRSSWLLRLGFDASYTHELLDRKAPVRARLTGDTGSGFRMNAPSTALETMQLGPVVDIDFGDNWTFRAAYTFEYDFNRQTAHHFNAAFRVRF